MRADLRLTRWLFLKSLALVYLVAFGSLWVQLDGLFGTQGLVPATALAEVARNQLGNSAYHLLPSLFWLWPQDITLKLLCGSGLLASGCLLFGLCPLLCLVTSWACYLSLVSFGAPFLQFQWDALLLETGFLAIFAAPLVWRSKGPSEDPPVSGAVIWMLRYLLFRLMFSSGLVKLAAGGPSWKLLTAMDFHYWTQPLPLPTAYYMALLPGWFHQVETLLVLLVELLVPWLIFCGARGRKVAFVSFGALMLLIMVTGNYGFFNLLTLVLCLSLIEDDWWPGGYRLEPPTTLTDRWPRTLLLSVCSALLVLSLATWFQALRMRPPSPLAQLNSAVSGWRLTSGYGLFAVMTTERPELEIQGSPDGVVWKTYAFKYKAGPLDRWPSVAGPHMPRLDWQMWFAALGDAQRNRWVLSLSKHLMLGTPEVLGLLAEDPFEGNPPQQVRLILYHYEFTKAGGDWWRREKKGLYLGPLSLSER